MKIYLTILAIAVSVLKGAAQVPKKSICYSIKRDSITSDLFWSTFNKTYESLRADTAHVNIAWVEVPHGSNRHVLKKITINKDTIVIKNIINDQVVKEVFFLGDFQINSNILSLIKNLERGHYSVACTNWYDTTSTNAYFIFEKGSLIFNLFAGMSNLTEIPKLDKTLFLNAATLIESILEMEKD